MHAKSGSFVQEESKSVVIGLDELTNGAMHRQRRWWWKNHEEPHEAELGRDEIPCRNPLCDRRMRYGNRAWGVYLRNRLTGGSIVALFHSEKCHDSFLVGLAGRKR